VALLTAENVTVDVPILSLRARSLRSLALARARAVGGQIVDSGTNINVVRALDNVSFQLGQGDRLGLIGHNGAGKTTLIRVLAGIYTPTGGNLRVEGKLIPMFDIGLGFDEELTGNENISLRGLVMGLSPKEIAARADEIAAFSELGDYLNLPIRTYSAGMMLRLMFSIATCVRGDIVLMDEWIAVGDANFREKAQRRTLEIVGNAGVLVIASHDPDTLLRHCNLGMHLERGRVKDFGPIQEVLARAGQHQKARRDSVS